MESIDCEVQTGVQPGAQAGVQAGAQAGVQAGVQPRAQAGVQPSPPFAATLAADASSAALTTAILNLSQDISALRVEVADLRGDLRSVREQNSRQDSEIWAQDGTTRLEANRSILSSHSLQIKGIWATLTLLIGAAVSYASYHLR